jgi:hypothetical protein
MGIIDHDFDEEEEEEEEDYSLRRISLMLSYLIECVTLMTIDEKMERIDVSFLLLRSVCTVLSMR